MHTIIHTYIHAYNTRSHWIQQDPTPLCDRPRSQVCVIWYTRKRRDTRVRTQLHTRTHTRTQRTHMHTYISTHSISTHSIPRRQIASSRSADSKIAFVTSNTPRVWTVLLAASHHITSSSSSSSSCITVSVQAIVVLSVLSCLVVVATSPRAEQDVLLIH